LNELSIEDLLTFGNLISIEFMNPQQWLYLIPRRQVWVWQELRKKVLKQPVNHQMIGLAPKPRNMYINRKKWQIANWMKNQNPILYIDS
jgi:hypothetical protein